MTELSEWQIAVKKICINCLKHLNILNSEKHIDLNLKEVLEHLKVSSRFKKCYLNGLVFSIVLMVEKYYQLKCLCLCLCQTSQGL